MRARLPPARKKKKNQLEGVPTIYSYLLAARNVAETVRVVRLIRSFEEPLWATRPEYREAHKGIRKFYASRLTRGQRRTSSKSTEEGGKKLNNLREVGRQKWCNDFKINCQIFAC